MLEDNYMLRIDEAIVERYVAFRDVYAGKEPAHWRVCEEGRKQIIAHGAISQQAGVSVTPTLYVDRTPIVGFRRAVVEEALSSHSIQ